MTTKGPAIKYLDPGVITTTHANQAAAAAFVRTGRTAGDAVDDFNGRRLIGLPTPIANDEPATKGYLLSQIDSITGGLAWKDSCVTVSTANLDLTAAAFLTIVNGITPVVNDRILIKEQSTASQNGVYVVTSVGTGANDGTVARAADFNAWSETVNAIVPVQTGPTANAGTQWRATTVDGGTLDTTAINFVSSGAATPDATAAAAGAGVIGKLSVNSDFGLTIVSNALRIALATSSAMEFVAGLLKVKVEATNPTLEIDGSNQLKLKFSATASGLTQNGAGAAIKLESSNPSLQIDGSSQLGLKINTAKALKKTGSGVEVFNDGSSLTNVTADGSLQVGKVIEKAFKDTLTTAAGDITAGYMALSQVPLVIAQGLLTGKTGAGFSIPEQEYGTDYTVMNDGAIYYIVWKTSGTGLANGTHPTVGMVGDIVATDKLVYRATYANFTPAA